MLIIALVLAVIGLAALVAAVVTSNELIAWVCIGASVIGVLLLIVDAVRERSRTARSGGKQPETAVAAADTETVDYPDEDAETDDHNDGEDAVDAGDGDETDGRDVEQEDVEQEDAEHEDAVVDADGREVEQEDADQEDDVVDTDESEDDAALESVDADER